MTKPIAYERDGAAIYRRSFAVIREEVSLAHLPTDIAALALRLVHACGMPDIIDDLRTTPAVMRVARAALASGAPILCDARMVVSGIIGARLPARNRCVCLIDEPETIAAAGREHTTRSAAAVGQWRDQMAGAVVAIGNAPTALFRLLEEIDAGAPRPAAIFAFPVGFVGAIEAKDALVQDSRGIDYATLLGRRGGSGLAAAAINALAGNPEDR